MDFSTTTSPDHEDLKSMTLASGSQPTRQHFSLLGVQNWNSKRIMQCQCFEVVTGKLKHYGIAIENKRHGKTERNAPIQETMRKNMHGRKGREENTERWNTA